MRDFRGATSPSHICKNKIEVKIVTKNNKKIPNSIKITTLKNHVKQITKDLKERPKTKKHQV